jgi:sRNA-binding protein
MNPKLEADISLAPEPTPSENSTKTAIPARASAQPVLEKLFELYPHLFGAEFLPLKLGVFQELLALHPEHFKRDTLKLALGVHARSTRYLQCVAAGKLRHDLQGNAVEPVAPEHVYLAVVELFRRRQARSTEDLRPKLHRQLMVAFEASGLGRQDYLEKVQVHDAQAYEALEPVFSEHAEKLAKQVALCSAFEASGTTPEVFADMYGIDKRELVRAMEARKIQNLA